MNSWDVSTLARGFNSWLGKNYKNSDPRYLESYLTGYLKKHAFFQRLFPLEQLKLKNSVLHEVRSLRAKKGANTRRKQKQRKADAERIATERAKQLSLL